MKRNEKPPHDESDWSAHKIKYVGEKKKDKEEKRQENVDNAQLTESIGHA